MIKRLLLIVFLLPFCSSLKSQDLIATSYGDTLNVKVIYSTKRYLFYIDKGYNGKHRIRPIKKSRIEAVKMNSFQAEKEEVEVFERARSTMASFGMIQGGLD